MIRRIIRAGALSAAIVALAGTMTGAGDPAAVQGSLTSHGGTVVGGATTVLIGGQPVARVGDFAACPQVTGEVPHVGGPIATGSTTVLIGGQPVPTVGSIVSEDGFSSVIITGVDTVLIGG